VRGCDRGNNEVPVNPSTFRNPPFISFAVKKWSQKSKQLRLTPMVEKVEPKIKTTSTDSNGGSIKNYFYLNVQVCI
jgi:hypothetical protein